MVGLLEFDTNVEKLSTSGLAEFVVPVINTEEIGVDYTQSEIAQGELLDISKNVSQILADIEALKNMMDDGSWLGDFAQEYLSKTDKLKTDMEQIPPYINAVKTEISEYTETIRAIASNY